MAETYFSKFKSTYYANAFAIDLTERVALTSPVPSSPYVYYSYDITNGIRPDQIADEYYNDQFMDWVIYLSNKTIDPYYQWYLTDEKFNAFLKAKYDVSIPTLQNKIKLYRNNWYNGDAISVADYNALPPNQHRYYQPFYNVDTGEVVRYTRVRADWIINTNALVSVSCVGNTFSNDEVVYINFDATHQGRGQVSFANSTTIHIQHVSGILYANASVLITGNSYVYGTESKANVAFTATTSLANNIVTGEEIYWDSISVYDYENEINESKKSIKILDKGLSLNVSDKLTDLLAQ